MSQADKQVERNQEEYDGTIMFEQAYLQSRVVHTKNDTYNIEFAMLDGPSISIDEPSEIIAKTIYAGLDKAYREGLRELQEKMRDALSSIQDDAQDDDFVSSLYSEDNESEGA